MLFGVVCEAPLSRKWFTTPSSLQFLFEMHLEFNTCFLSNYALNAAEKCYSLGVYL